MRRKARNRRLTDVVAPGDAALSLTRCQTLPRLALLVRGKDRLSPEFHALRLRVGAASRSAFQDAAAFEFRGNAKNGENDLGEIGRGIKEWFGK